jgi:hypothetical protein
VNYRLEDDALIARAYLAVQRALPLIDLSLQPCTASSESLVEA